MFSKVKEVFADWIFEKWFSFNLALDQIEPETEALMIVVVCVSAIAATVWMLYEQIFTT